MSTNNTNNMGKTKRSTDDMIAAAISHQDNWLARRRTFTRRFLKTLNVESDTGHTSKQPESHSETRGSVLREYWFPILCAIVVLFVAVWTLFARQSEPRRVVMATENKPITQTVKKTRPTLTTPAFDIVRIKQDGMIIVAGRWKPNTGVSVTLNGKIVATEQTNSDGEFVYAPWTPLKPGNYTLALIGVNPEVKSEDRVFLYISDQGYKNSLSLLMTSDGSRILQSPETIQDGDLVVSKIDYLDTGRIVVTGDALPRMRISLSLNDKYLGFARVSDYRHFGLGSDVGELQPGTEYSLVVRMHDGDGQTIATVTHNFVMPEMTGDNDTFYTVRRGDCLWVIARNFLGRGVLFSVIAERNNIQNPDLIFPKQLLQIPMK